MSLITKVTLESGIEITNAYITIGRLEEQNKYITIYVETFLDQAAYLEGKPYVSRKSYNFDADVSENSLNYRKQGYEFMKTMDEYGDAIDVLEEGQTPLVE
ncbi:hypothetical protein [Niallia circulans]|uniref:Uncharacterized protein n=1 Tax=Niallia circulans TaxID=1397 RepID=A0A941GEF4_NIACI|nr:hypothetical protein [Niallia circulans]MCB5235517.1 hypothetical protein [Niallia circulans]